MGVWVVDRLSLALLKDLATTFELRDYTFHIVTALSATRNPWTRNRSCLAARAATLFLYDPFNAAWKLPRHADLFEKTSAMKEQHKEGLHAALHWLNRWSKSKAVHANRPWTVTAAVRIIKEGVASESMGG